MRYPTITGEWFKSCIKKYNNTKLSDEERIENLKNPLIRHIIKLINKAKDYFKEKYGDDYVNTHKYLIKLEKTINDGLFKKQLDEKLKKYFNKKSNQTSSDESDSDE